MAARQSVVAISQTQALYQLVKLCNCACNTSGFTSSLIRVIATITTVTTITAMDTIFSFVIQLIDCTVVFHCKHIIHFPNLSFRKKVIREVATLQHAWATTWCFPEMVASGAPAAAAEHELEPNYQTIRGGYILSELSEVWSILIFLRTNENAFLKNENGLAALTDL